MQKPFGQKAYEKLLMLLSLDAAHVRLMEAMTPDGPALVVVGELDGALVPLARLLTHEEIQAMEPRAGGAYETLVTAKLATAKLPVTMAEMDSPVLDADFLALV